MHYFNQLMYKNRCCALVWVRWCIFLIYFFLNILGKCSNIIERLCLFSKVPMYIFLYYYSLYISCDAHQHQSHKCVTAFWVFFNNFMIVFLLSGNHFEIVQMLLEHKPNVNALDKDGYTALAIACKEGYYDIALALINSGAYINVQVNLIHNYKFRCGTLCLHWWHMKNKTEYVFLYNRLIK